MSMIANNTYKNIALQELKENRNYLNMGGLGLTIGTFDLFHAGHLDFLEWCKRSVDVLVVGVKSDSFCENKTIYSEKDRSDLVMALPHIDFVCVIDEMKEIIRLVNPEFYLKGPHYNFETLSLEEKEALESGGTVDGKMKAQVRFGTLVRDISKKLILEKIHEQK